MGNVIPYSNEVALRSLAAKSGLEFREVVGMAERDQLHLAVARVNSPESRARHTSVRRGGRGTMSGRVALRLANALRATPLSP